MVRDNQLEILESAVIPEALVKSTYDDLARIHGWLGDTSVIVRAIRRNALPVRRILEVGCGTGLILENVRRRLGADVVGVDIDPHPNISAPVPILRADAVRDELPRADVAFSMNVCHHMDEDELIQTIRNVGRSCSRFVILDLIRHPLPLALFRVFLHVEDGERSIRRAYTPEEMRRVVTRALSGTSGAFKLSVAPFYIRQVVDITYCVSRERHLTV